MLVAFEEANNAIASEQKVLAKTRIIKVLRVAVNPYVPG